MILSVSAATAPAAAAVHKRRVSITERVLKAKNTEQQLSSITVSMASKFVAGSFFFYIHDLFNF